MQVVKFLSERRRVSGSSAIQNPVINKVSNFYRSQEPPEATEEMADKDKKSMCESAKGAVSSQKEGIKEREAEAPLASDHSHVPSPSTGQYQERESGRDEDRADPCNSSSSSFDDSYSSTDSTEKVDQEGEMIAKEKRKRKPNRTSTPKSTIQTQCEGKAPYVNKVRRRIKLEEVGS